MNRNQHVEVIRVLSISIASNTVFGYGFRVCLKIGQFIMGTMIIIRWNLGVAWCILFSWIKLNKIAGLTRNLKIVMLFSREIMVPGGTILAHVYFYFYFLHDFTCQFEKKTRCKESRFLLCLVG